MSTAPDGPLLDAAFIRRLLKLEIVARRSVSSDLRGDHRARRRGASLHFRDHKEYTQGDDLRFLDWNAYSRLGELLIKNFEAEEQVILTLLVDASGSMGLGVHDKFLVSRRIAAALGVVTLNRSAGVELALLRGPERAERRVFRGRRDFRPFMGLLEGAVAGGPLDLQDAVAQAAGGRRGRGVVVLISDFFHESGYERPLRLLRHLGYDVAAIHVLDRVDVDPFLTGRLRLSDAETSRTAVEDMDAALLHEYATEARRWCDGVKHFCLSSGIAYVRVPTDAPIDDVVRQMLFSGSILR